MSNCTGSHLYDPQLQHEPYDGLMYYDWLERWKYSDEKGRKLQYLREQRLCIDPEDPKDYPGLHHAAELTASCNFKKLDQHQQVSLRKMIARVYKENRTYGLFFVGDVFGKNKHWKVVRQMSDAEGFFNCGLYVVESMSGEVDGPGILKVLPHADRFEKYASREIDILWKLVDHPNIIDIYESFLPDKPQSGPWIITGYCNGGTLENFAHDIWERKIRVPELFIWHVFGSLLVAVNYCHTGPTDKQPGTWDPIHHRDIVLGNIFLDFSDSADHPYPTIKLADFGCAVTQSDLEERARIAESGERVDLLAQICPSAVPPEGEEEHSSSVDIWQLGLAVLRFLAISRLGYKPDGPKDSKPEPVIKCIDGHYADRMWDLRQLLMTCIAEDPSHRPTAKQLLDELRNRRSELMVRGKLKFRPLQLK